VVDEDAAVELAISFGPDLIIMDVFLKNKTSGLNAGRPIRESKIEKPIIYTTGNSLQQTKESIKEISNSHLFIKPIDASHLIKYIEDTF
jgi:AmiR/NasT family two-component response regulator